MASTLQSGSARPREGLLHADSDSTLSSGDDKMDAVHEKASPSTTTPSLDELDSLNGSITRTVPPTVIPTIGAGRPYPPQINDKDAYLVDFDGDNDPAHPMNWALRRKIAITAIVTLLTLTATFGSAIFSVHIYSVAAEYDLSIEVTLLGISLYVLGFAIAPILWGPSSEVFGRRLPILIASIGFIIFNVAVASAKDPATIFICRFFGGFFGACPLAVVPAIFVDMFVSQERSVAVTVYAVAVFAGPFAAPAIGGFIDQNAGMGWRWTEWLTAMMGALSLILAIFFVPETFAPIILAKKAARLRKQADNWAIHAKHEELHVDIRTLLRKNFAKPLRMLCAEPILFLISLYVAFIYGMMYLCLTFYPIVFQQIRHMSQGIGGLPYLGLIVGQLFAMLYIIAEIPSHSRKVAANHGVPCPESRLVPSVIIGGISFAVGIFMLGWTGYMSSIHWSVPAVSGIFTGFGLLLIFLQSLAYLVDVYLVLAASAMAANTMLRSLFGAIFPLFSRYLAGIGINWACTILGCIALLMVPAPIIFYIKGPQIRRWSKYATVIEPNRPVQQAV